MRLTMILAGCTVLAALLVPGLRADEEKVPLDKLPKTVVNAVKDRFPRGELVEASKETEDGKTEYEVSLKRGEHHIDVMVTPEGKITLIEKTIDIDDLPKKVSAAVKAKHPKGKVTKAEEVITVSDDKETLDYYEVDVEENGKSVEIKVLINGKIKAEEKKDEKKN
jgi:hypothetical protein